MKTMEQLGISPTPWTEEAGDFYKRVVHSNGNHLCGLEGYHNDADAKLIAAAPSLYEALAAMLSCAEKNAPYLDMSHMDIAMDMARKAIAKAGGAE